MNEREQREAVRSLLDTIVESGTINPIGTPATAHSNIRLLLMREISDSLDGINAQLNSIASILHARMQS